MGVFTMIPVSVDDRSQLKNKNGTTKVARPGALASVVIPDETVPALTVHLSSIDEANWVLKRARVTGKPTYDRPNGVRTRVQSDIDFQGHINWSNHGDRIITNDRRGFGYWMHSYGFNSETTIDNEWRHLQLTRDGVLTAAWLATATAIFDKEFSSLKPGYGRKI